MPIDISARHRLLEEKFQPETMGGRPILELAARVWPQERYHAFRVCYKTMRLVDDLVDQGKADGRFADPRRKQAARQLVASWMLNPSANAGPGFSELEDVRQRFQLPDWPWERWTAAMLYDLDHSGFSSFLEYLRYCEGAAVAPGAIFMHLCGLTGSSERGYAPPAFDIRQAARPLAIFCYVVHIMRDFQTDQRMGLHYFPDHVLARFALDRRQLAAIAAGGTIPSRFRHMMSFYHRCADYYAKLAANALRQVSPNLEEVYCLSLELVFGLYRQIYQRMDPWACGFTAAETSPDPQAMHREVEAILLQYHLA